MSESSVSERPSLESLRSHTSFVSIQSHPDTLPPAITGRLVWNGSELAPEQYVVELRKEEIEDIRAAVISFKCKNRITVQHWNLRCRLEKLAVTCRSCKF
jgi:hypothetical protein